MAALVQSYEYSFTIIFLNLSTLGDTITLKNALVACGDLMGPKLRDF